MREKRWVVDLGLEKFFDRVNHDILMSRVVRKVKDKRVLKLIRRYLKAGIMADGVTSVPLLPRLKVSPDSVKRLKAKVKAILRMGRGRSLSHTIESLKSVLRGWFNYFRLAEVKNVFEDLDG